MKYLRLFVTVGFTLILSQSAFTQPPSQKPKAPVKNVAKEKSDAKLEAERLQKERQSQVRALLISLASDARSFRDQTLRARSLARIADALWEIDAEQGRTLFRKAWEAAEIANQEANERLNIRDGAVAGPRFEHEWVIAGHRVERRASPSERVRDPQPGKPARFDLPRQIADAVERMTGDVGIGAGDVDDMHSH